jgi:hypothetical protein
VSRPDGDEPEDWPEPPPNLWEPAEYAVPDGGDLQHALLIDVTAKDLERDRRRAAKRAWDRTGFGFQP